MQKWKIIRFNLFIKQKALFSQLYEFASLYNTLVWCIIIYLALPDFLLCVSAPSIYLYGMVSYRIDTDSFGYQCTHKRDSEPILIYYGDKYKFFIENLFLLQSKVLWCWLVITQYTKIAC